MPVTVEMSESGPSRQFATPQNLVTWGKADFDRTALMPGSILLAGSSCLTKITCYR